MKPVMLYMENFVSHSKSVIDFRKFNAALIIGSHTNNPDISNGAGKSAIFNAIRWVLYNKSRFSTKDKVVKRGCPSCKVIFIFEADDNSYKVVRKYSSKNNILDVTFYKLDNGKWQHKGYTCDTNTATTDRIIEIIGMSHDTFINSIYFRQSDIAGFALATTAKRKNILKEVLQIGIWDDFQKTAKIYSEKLAIQQESLSKRLEDLGDIEQEKEKTNKFVDKKNNDIKTVEDDIKQLEGIILKLEEQITIIESSITNVIDKKRLETRLIQIKNRGQEIKDLRATYKTQSIKNNEEIARYYNECLLLAARQTKLCQDVLAITGHRSREEAEKILLQNSISKLPAPKYDQDVLAQHRQEHSKLQGECFSLNNQIKQLQFLEPGKECPTCLTELNDLSDVAKRREAKLKFLQNQVVEKDAVIKDLEHIIQQEQMAINTANDAALEINQIGLIIAKHQVSANEIERKNKDIQANLLLLGKEWNELKTEKSGIEIGLRTHTNTKQEELDKLQRQKNKQQEILEEKRRNLVGLSIEKGQFLGYLKELERRVSEKHTIMQQNEKILLDLEAYSRLTKAFGKDGIQAIIMENIAEDLRQYTNSILCKLTNDPMSIDFLTQRKTTTGNWKEDFGINVNIDGNIVSFDDLSGGEQVRVAFALRLALSRLLMRRVGSDIRFLLLDEVDQSLDKYGVEVLAESIHALSDEFNILLITHNDLMKDKFEHIISVQKGPSGSSLRQ